MTLAVRTSLRVGALCGGGGQAAQLCRSRSLSSSTTGMTRVSADLGHSYSYLMGAAVPVAAAGPQAKPRDRVVMEMVLQKGWRSVKFQSSKSTLLLIPKYVQDI